MQCVCSWSEMTKNSPSAASPPLTAQPPTTTPPPPRATSPIKRKAIISDENKSDESVKDLEYVLLPKECFTDNEWHLLSVCVAGWMCSVISFLTIQIPVFASSVVIVMLQCMTMWLHSRIWKYCPKHKIASKETVDVAVATATAIYYTGHVGSSINTLLGIPNSMHINNHLKSLDKAI